MGVIVDRGRYYWVKRVPKRYLGLVLGRNGKPITLVKQALHTDSKREATTKATRIEASRMAEWEALAAGDNENARAHYEAAQILARSRGYAYKPLDTLVKEDIEERGALVDRVLSVGKGNFSSPAAADAVLGIIPEIQPTLTQVRDEYYELTKTRHLKKTPQQLKRWRQPRDRAVKNFLEVVAKRDGRGTPIPMPVNEISRDDVLLFRSWWADRVSAGMDPSTANKDLGHLSEMWNTWTQLKNVGLENPFSKMRFEVRGKNRTKTPPFSRDWIQTKILAPGALDGLNAEARDIFLMMINTGLRPSEITDAPLEDFVLQSNIPHLCVRENGREIKVVHTERDIPLTGVSLEAARRIFERGGILRYRHKANSWSAAVNKFLTNNGLKETPKHVAYSLRHYVEDALWAAKVDDRIRADILGHEYKRPNYGDGGALEGRREALELISLR